MIAGADVHINGGCLRQSYPRVRGLNQSQRVRVGRRTTDGRASDFLVPFRVRGLHALRLGYRNTARALC